MGKFLDRTGLKYGRLTVMSHNGRDKRNKHLWLCKCECGNEKVVVSDLSVQKYIGRSRNFSQYGYICPYFE